MTEKVYELHIAGLTRKLPLRRVSEHLQIASFIMLGDTELVEACAGELAKHVPGDVKYLICPETKAIPLAHAMARILGIDYVVIRKTVKSYMADPIITEVHSITTPVPQQLVLDSVDVEKIRGRKVALVDDVVSTGGSLKAMETILARTDCEIVACLTPLLEEAGHSGEGVTYLEKLPVFPD